jgi:NTP pyrophosphatase (non-canonical NTP hydrolase)
MSKQDIEAALGYEYYTKVEQSTCSGYSAWVESMVITEGKDRLVENTLGLVGEAGEFAEKVKKMIRDGTFDKDLATKELGDVLFYLTALANYFGSSLQEVLEQNVIKLNDRKNRGVLRGSGDNR